MGTCFIVNSGTPFLNKSFLPLWTLCFLQDKKQWLSCSTWHYSERVFLILSFLKWALFLVNHMTPFGCGCLLKFPVWSSFSKPKQIAHRKGYGNYFFFSFWYVQLSVFSLEVHKMGGKLPQTRCKQVTEVSMHQKKCHLHPVIF